MFSDESRLSHIIEGLVRALRAAAANEEVSQAAAGVLRRLSDDGPQRVTRLAGSEGVSQPAMTQLIARLADAGLVERRVPAGDRRAVDVHATPAGLAVLERRRDRRARKLRQYLDRLDAPDQAAVAAALPALERLVEAMAAGMPGVGPDQQKG